MYIINITSDDATKDSLLRAPKVASLALPIAEAGQLRSSNTPANNSQFGVQPQVVAPNGLTQSKISDLIAQAGVISSIGTFQLNDLASPAPLGGEVSSISTLEGKASFSQNVLAHLSSNESAVPVINLSDVNLGQNVLGVTGTSGTVSQNGLNGLADAKLPSVGSGNNARTIIDVSSLAASGTPVAITALSDSSITVISNIGSNVQIQDLAAPLAATEYFINTNKAGILTVTTNATKVSSLSLSESVVFTAKADEVTTGITVSGLADPGDVSLSITGDTGSQTNNSDVITLGNGNNYVFDAGNGQILLSLGNGQHTVILGGVGITGQINLTAPAHSIADAISTAANGKLSANDPATQPVAGDASSLVSWIAAAKTQSSTAHSVAWFQFGGNTYVLEAATDMSAGHAGDTLIKLVGLTQSSGSSELSPGTLNLAG